MDDILDELKEVIVGDYDKKLHEIEKVKELLKERVVERNWHTNRFLQYVLSISMFIFTTKLRIMEGFPQ